MGFHSRTALEKMGFASIGKNVQISDRSSIYGAERIELESNIRVDDFCVISAGAGGIYIGNHVHLAFNASLVGAGRITLFDFVGISSRGSIYSSNDDYSGRAMTGPTLPAAFTNVSSRPVTLHKHVIVGSGSIILPGVTVGQAVAIGALSLVRKDCEEFSVYSGNPAKKIMDRQRDLLELEREFRSQLGS